jgi:hypothetical protein
VLPSNWYFSQFLRPSLPSTLIGLQVVLRVQGSLTVDERVTLAVDDVYGDFSSIRCFLQEFSHATKMWIAGSI